MFSAGIHAEPIVLRNGEVAAAIEGAGRQQDFSIPFNSVLFWTVGSILAGAWAESVLFWA